MFSSALRIQFWKVPQGDGIKIGQACRILIPQNSTILQKVVYRQKIFFQKISAGQNNAVLSTCWFLFVTRVKFLVQFPIYKNFLFSQKIQFSSNWSLGQLETSFNYRYDFFHQNSKNSRYESENKYEKISSQKNNIAPFVLLHT